MRKTSLAASAVAALLLLALGASPVNAAQIAASIDYDREARPAGLPDDMQPLAGASLQFLAITAIDGFKV